VWTPKRIVLLVLGFSLFFTGYFTYSFVLGGIDGLPPLPEGYDKPIDCDVVVPKRPTSSVEEKLKQAFGPECPELKLPVKLELSRNNMVLAADTARPDDKGRLVMRPFRVAIFGKPKNDGREIEINTVCADVAYLTFDKPIASTINLGELNGRKIVGAELSSNIAIINNRRTPRRDDDLELFIKTGPLYYDEPKHLISTYDVVHVTDRHVNARPNEVLGKGMELELLVEAASPTTAGHKPHQDSITGVKRITLQSNVDMELYVDGRSGFFNHADDKTAARPPVKASDPGDQAQLHITTPGRFDYLFFKGYDMAHFEVTPGNLQLLGGTTPRDVTVVRHNPKLGTTDQLFCQNLDLRLIRQDPKEAGADKNARAAGADAPDIDQKITIEWAHATAPDGKVTLTSDTEKLSVTEVDDLQHEAKTGTTVLKAKERLKAIKEDNLLVARELHIQEVKIADSDKTYQSATAFGPGQIDLFDKKTSKRLQHAYWNDKLISTKDERAFNARGEMQDMLIITGKARFHDEEHAQTLEAETLKVWLGAGNKPGEKATLAANSGESVGAKIDHLEAIQNVTAHSRELNVHHTARLVVWFKDAPPTMLPASQDVDLRLRTTLPPALPGGPLPPPVPEGLPRRLPDGPPEAPHPAPSNPRNPETAAPAEPVKAAPAAKPEEPARPLDLSAQSVEAWVLREEVKNTLDKLWCEGSVHVHQAPAKEGEQPVDITGDTLNMVHHDEGDFLEVISNDLAHLQMDQIYVVGPVVDIDRAQNKAWVTGAGAMRIDSKTTLDGKPAEDVEPLDIHWEKSMLLYGKYAEFNVGIQAQRGEEKMACNTLCVSFDRPIPLKEGNKGGESPKVKNLLCDQNARAENTVKELGTGRLLKYERLESPVITTEAIEQDEAPPPPQTKDNNGWQIVRAGQGGRFRIVQRGGTDPLAQPTEPKPNHPGGAKPATKPAPSKPGAKPADDDALKLTLVEFAGSMYANSMTNEASFRKNVRVLYMPVEDPKIDVDIDATLAKLPEGAMYLSCHELKVYTREEKGKKYQEMNARDQAVVQSNDFWGRAANIHFDESKDQVIFDGGPGGKATLYKMTQVGAPPQVIRGDKIIYNRRTGEFTGDHIEMIQAN
jgi:hypothetical protein